MPQENRRRSSEPPDPSKQLPKRHSTVISPNPGQKPPPPQNHPQNPLQPLPSKIKSKPKTPAGRESTQSKVAFEPHHHHHPHHRHPRDTFASTQAASGLLRIVSKLDFQNDLPQQPSEDQLILELEKKPKDMYLFKDLKNIEDSEDQILPPAHRFFHAPIKGHPDRTTLKEYQDRVGIPRASFGEDDDEDSDNDEPPSEIIVSKGRVLAIQVDNEVVEEMEENRKHAENVCQCCREEKYTVSHGLANDLSIQGKFIFKILMLEIIVRAPSLFWLQIQYSVPALHDFLYEQWLLSSLFIAVFFITLVWAVVLSDLGRMHPCDKIILVGKSTIASLVCVLITASIERYILDWRVTHLDLDEPEDLDTLYMAREAKPQENLFFTYPVVVPIFLVGNTLVFSIEACYFRFLKGDTRKDTMFWIAVACYGCILILEIFVSNAEMLPPFFQGPKEWNLVQFIIPTFVGCTWVLWRMFNIREILEGTRFHVHEDNYIMPALSFAI